MMMFFPPLFFLLVPQIKCHCYQTGNKFPRPCFPSKVLNNVRWFEHFGRKINLVSLFQNSKVSTKRLAFNCFKAINLQPYY